jgi:hypothetical protein
MKNKKKLIGLVLFGIVATITFSSYKVDLLPKSLKNDANGLEMEKKGKLILKQAWNEHGIDAMQSHKVYSYTGVDSWVGMIGKMGKLWPDAVIKVKLKSVIGTFDSKIEFLDGKEAGNKAGLQAWKYYEEEKDSLPDFDVELNRRHKFGLAAFQYFNEMVARLSNAPIIRYAGEETFNETEYDLVFATWETLEATKKNDQYVLYINKKTHRLDYVIYTIRDNYLKMPGASFFYGSMSFKNYKRVNGALVPFQQSAFMNKMKEDNEGYLHQINIDKFEFDTFDAKELYPNKALGSLGDSKN